jgi:hypothetical protein
MMLRALPLLLLASACGKDDPAPGEGDTAPADQGDDGSADDSGSDDGGSDDGGSDDGSSDGGHDSQAGDTSGDSRPGDTALARDTSGDTAGEGGKIPEEKLYGSYPDKEVALPEFTAQNRDGALRDREDLLGRYSVVWFYPAAGTSG